MTEISSWLLPEFTGRCQDTKLSGTQIASFHISVNLFEIIRPTNQTEHF